MLICTENACEHENQLAAAGCEIIHATDGESAIDQIRLAPFDATVIVSTGKNMDIVETALNLRELRPAMPIIVVNESENSAEIRESTIGLGPQVKLVKSSEITLALALRRHAAATHRSR